VFCYVRLCWQVEKSISGSHCTGQSTTHNAVQFTLHRTDNYTYCSTVHTAPDRPLHILLYSSHCTGRSTTHTAVQFTLHRTIHYTYCCTLHTAPDRPLHISCTVNTTLDRPLHILLYSSHCTGPSTTHTAVHFTLHNASGSRNPQKRISRTRCLTEGSHTAI
jgi:hypothetical protein